MNKPRQVTLIVRSKNTNISNSTFMGIKYEFEIHKSKGEFEVGEILKLTEIPARLTDLETHIMKSIRRHLIDVKRQLRTLNYLISEPETKE